jgi:hypothetical protein
MGQLADRTAAGLCWYLRRGLKGFKWKRSLPLPWEGYFFNNDIYNPLWSYLEALKTVF